MRTIDCHYQDPLELVWIAAARQWGMHVVRDATVFASWDGDGTLKIGTPETLDPDDSVAQMILHELCHALVEGPAAFRLPDWGLDIHDPSQRVHEHACLRLQAALADRYGLRHFLAATTNFRKYYDALPDRPLEECGDPAVPLAGAGWRRAQRDPWSNPLDTALQATADIAKRVLPLAPDDPLWRRVQS